MWFWRASVGSPDSSVQCGKLANSPGATPCAWPRSGLSKTNTPPKSHLSMCFKYVFFSIIPVLFVKASQIGIQRLTLGTIFLTQMSEVLKFQLYIKKIVSFNVWVRYFVWNFKGTLWNSTQNILPIHWRMWILFTVEYFRALRFKSSYICFHYDGNALSFNPGLQYPICMVQCTHLITTGGTPHQITVGNNRSERTHSTQPSKLISKNWPKERPGKP